MDEPDVCGNPRSSWRETAPNETVYAGLGVPEYSASPSESGVRLDVPLRSRGAVPTTPLRFYRIGALLNRQPEPPAFVTYQPSCFNIGDIESRLPLRTPPGGWIHWFYGRNDYADVGFRAHASDLLSAFISPS